MLSEVMPKVTVVTLTIPGREGFLYRAKQQFKAQDYPNKELVIVDCAGNTGFKRNVGCEAAQGEIIVHMDDDDWYSPDWVSKSVAALTSSGADLVGLRSMYFYDLRAKKHFIYDPPTNWNTILYGATQCYWRKTWQAIRFEHRERGEDSEFSHRCRKFCHDYREGFVAIRHDGNTGGTILGSFPFKEIDKIPNFEY